MKTVATLIAALLLGGAFATPAAGQSAGVASCATAKRGPAYVTQVQWASGATTTRRNLTARTDLFPGDRELWRSPSRRKDSRITGCRVLTDGTVLVRTGAGARYGFAQPPAPTVVQPVEVAPSPAAPAAVGAWDRPIVLMPSVDGSWGLDAAAAAWNAALPADRQISIGSECVAGSACIPVGVEDFTDYEWQHSALARWNYRDGRMTSCSIALNENVQTEMRPMILAHEVGHCLGLPHWATEGLGKWTIMSESGPRSEVVSSWDLAWLTSVYSSR